MLVKNVGLTVIVAAQLASLILTAARRSGLLEAGAEIIEAAVLLLSHLAWGNMVSVAAPFKMQFYRFASNGARLTAMAGSTIGSAPGFCCCCYCIPSHRGRPWGSPRYCCW